MNASKANQVAKNHGFTAIAEFQILDEDGSMALPVEGAAVVITARGKEKLEAVVQSIREKGGSAWRHHNAGASGE